MDAKTATARTHEFDVQDIEYLRAYYQKYFHSATHVAG